MGDSLSYIDNLLTGVNPQDVSGIIRDNEAKPIPRNVFVKKF